MESLAEVLRSIPDHRGERGKRHELVAMLLLLCTGMLCGVKSLQGLTRWGKQQESVLLKVMGFPRGKAPGYGTLQRLIRQVDVVALESALATWAEAVWKRHKPNEAWPGVALDGKVLRGSRNGELPGVHVLTLLSHGLGITLAQTEVPVTTNEHKASLPLLEGMHLTNQVVTGDALFMQRDVCNLIVQQQGHYLIILKENQPQLYETVRDWFEPFPPSRRMGHGQC